MPRWLYIEFRKRVMWAANSGTCFDVGYRTQSQVEELTRELASHVSGHHTEKDSSKIDRKLFLKKIHSLYVVVVNVVFVVFVELTKNNNKTSTTKRILFTCFIKRVLRRLSHLRLQERNRDRHAGSQAGRDRQTDKQTDRDRQTGRQMWIWMYKNNNSSPSITLEPRHRDRDRQKDKKDGQKNT